MTQPPNMPMPGQTAPLPMPGDAPGLQPQAQNLMMALKGATHNGAVPMMPGGDISSKYPNLKTMSHVDWQKVNPRLLALLNKEATKMNLTIAIDSGYRDQNYNGKVAGHPSSGHMRGTSVDAFINGHPIGEVIDPAKLGKLGLSVGGHSGDPSHVDLAGIPIKGGPSESASASPDASSASAGPGGQDQGLSGAGGINLSGG